MLQTSPSAHLDTHPTPERVANIDATFRAANYLSVAQLYLRRNALLREPLAAGDIKPRLLGHWGTVPGINFTYAHLSRLIQDSGDDIPLIVGTGHGAPGVLANLWLEGTLGDVYPQYARDRNGFERLAHDFSWPGGMPSHLTALTPGTLHEGGELGYSLSHAFGVAFDNPDTIVACLIGDGEAETGPLAAAWQSYAFVNPHGDGAVLPILHLNGYKLSGPAVLARRTPEELHDYFAGMGYDPREVSAMDAAHGLGDGESRHAVHEAMWEALDWAHERIRTLQHETAHMERRWPLIILRTPKGWTCPETLDGEPLEGTVRTHQIPIEDPATNPAHLHALEKWLESYDPRALFGDDAQPSDEVLATFPPAPQCIGRNPHANGGALLVPLQLPDRAKYAVPLKNPGAFTAEGTRILGTYLRDLIVQNESARNFRIVSPDETTSNRLNAVFDVTARAFELPEKDTDHALARDGRVMEVLSEHDCEGWLEGYVLSGRHGIFACYEAFLSIVDSMMLQYAKWIKMASETTWRRPVASLNYLVTSHVWEQDHNGYSHQGPGFINMLRTRKPSISRVYLPPDANCLLSVAEHCLASRNYVNLVVASKKPALQWLTIDEATVHCAAGASAWPWAGTDDADPEIVLAAAGDVPTRETMAAAEWLATHVPELRFRVVNVVDLFSLLSPGEHPHGLAERAFARLFGESLHVVFAFHGYPDVIHQLVHHRPDPPRFHVRGYVEEGTTTTPFDMTVRNGISRYQLAMLALEHAGRMGRIPELEALLAAHAAYIVEHDEDPPEIQHWRWHGRTSHSAMRDAGPSVRR
jgi:xylulose-5-phosphate/fructose-6-phosphate phosphoketolase